MVNCWLIPYGENVQPSHKSLYPRYFGKGLNRSFPRLPGSPNPGCFDSLHLIRRDMKSVLQPSQLLLLILAGWINRHQKEVLEYLRAENQVLIDRRISNAIYWSRPERGLRHETSRFATRFGE